MLFLELFAAIKEIVPPAEMEVVMFAPEKQVREERVRNLKDMLCEKFADKEEWLPLIDEAVYQYEKKTVRKMILKDHKRPDGREITQIRPLAAFQEFMVLQCLQEARLRFVTYVHLHLFQMHRR